MRRTLSMWRSIPMFAAFVFLTATFSLVPLGAVAQQPGDPAEAAASEETASELRREMSEAPEPKSLYELLDLVEKGFQDERAQNERREIEFERAKQDRQRLVEEAVATLAGEELRSQRLEEEYNENESTIGENEAQLAERLGQLGELFGVVRQVATDTGAQIWDSLTSSQLGPRKEVLDRLGRSKELPSTQDLEKLWFELQREMTEQGQIVRYTAKVLTAAGRQEEREVIRAGPFSVISEGSYLMW